MFCRIIKAHYHHEQDHHFSPEKEDALHTDTKLVLLVGETLFQYYVHARFLIFNVNLKMVDINNL